MAQFIRGASTERYCNSVVQKHSRPPHEAHSEMVLTGIVAGCGSLSFKLSC